MRRTSTDELRAGRPTRAQFLTLPRAPVVLVVGGLKLANLGSIFRTADAARIEHLYLAAPAFHPSSLRFRKASKGTDRWVPHSVVESMEACIDDLCARGYHLVALEQAHGAVPYSAAQYRFPVALVVGSERDGVSQEVLSRMESAVEIPMAGMANSLNVAVATGIVLFDIVRKVPPFPMSPSPAAACATAPSPAGVP